jgi:hypothetical protein
MWKTAFHRVLVISMAIGLAGIGYFYWRSPHESTAAAVPNEASPVWLDAVKADDASDQTELPNEEAGAPVQQEGGPPTTPEGWSALYHSSPDRFEFIKMASDAALRGDGRAAFYVSEALLTCLLVAHTYRGSQDPEAQFAQEQARHKGPQWHADQLERNFRRCIRLASEDPLAHLPERTEGYPRQYWYDLALELGDPMAKFNRAAMSLSRLSDSRSKEQKALMTVQIKADLRDIVSSQDPHALHVLGFTLMDGRYSSNPFRGMAIALTACDLGFDCTPNNPNSLNAVCKESLECSPHESFTEDMQRQLGRKFGEVYAMSEEFKEALARNDESVLNRFIEIKAP